MTNIITNLGALMRPLSLLLALFAGRGLSAAEPMPMPQPTKDTLAVAAGLNSFGCDLYGLLRAQPGNLCFSPFSIHTALDMTWAGAAGSTAAEFAAVLHALPDERSTHEGADALAHRHEQAKDYELAVANRLFGRQGETFKAPFLALCNDVYGAPLELVTFPDPGRTRINGWVEERTTQRIKDLIPAGSVDASTALVLVNAIYFKGTWAVTFDKSKTRDDTFTVTAGKTVKAPFMFRSDTMLIAKMESATLVELPYAGGELAMDLIIPQAPDGLEATEQHLNATLLQAAIGDLRPTKIDLFLPRFTVRWGTVSLNEPLKALGLTSAFGAADLSRMSDGKLRISNVFHQAFVAVDEEGTVAAAATAVAATRSVPVPPVQVRADHPFLFLIRDVKTKAVLFMGRVVDPT